MGDYGRVLIIGGSVGYSGAPCLSALPPMRSGAGLSGWVCRRASYYYSRRKNVGGHVPFRLEDSEGIFQSTPYGDIKKAGGV